jgi:hypothetical protein
MKNWKVCCFVVLVSVFALHPSAAAQQSQEKVLYSFQGGTDGQWPLGKVVFDAAGNLYGVTQAGGSATCTSYGLCGTVYQLAPPAQPGDPWTETVLHVFQGHTTGDASDPLGGLVMDANGNLYGATGGGGTGNCEILGTFPGCGAVYEVSPPAEKGGAWTETVLYSFQGGTDGAFPFGDIVFDNAGNLYGATQFGGGYGTQCGDTFYKYCGTVFEMSPSKVKGGPWTEQVLYSFKGLTGSNPWYGDGANPNGGLLIDKTGAIYGATQTGGFNCPHSSFDGCGVVYKLEPPAKSGGSWTETVLQRFSPQMNQREPNGGLLMDAKGNLYGTTFGGGTMYRLSPNSGTLNSWSETILYAFFFDVGGYDPEVPLVVTKNGALCGTTNTGSGKATRGTIFCMKPATLGPDNYAFESLYEFQGPPDGEYPAAGLTANGSNFYGTTQSGGTALVCGFSGCGTVFAISP